MLTLEEALKETRSAVEAEGVVWTDTNLPSVTHKRNRTGCKKNLLRQCTNASAYYSSLSNTVTYYRGKDISRRTIWHELGHAMSRTGGPGFTYMFIVGDCSYSADSGISYNVSCQKAAEDYCYREYGCHGNNNDQEQWADAFAAFVCMSASNCDPNDWEIKPNNSTYDPQYDQNAAGWRHICNSVSETLAQRYGGNGQGKAC